MLRSERTKILYNKLANFFGDHNVKTEEDCIIQVYPVFIDDINYQPSVDNMIKIMEIFLQQSTDPTYEFRLTDDIRLSELPFFIVKNDSQTIAMIVLRKDPIR